MAKRGAPDPLRNSPITAAFKRMSDEQLRETASGAPIAERYVSKFLGDAAVANLRALMPENRAAVALEAFRRIEKGATVDEVNAWLSLAVLDQRLALEEAAQESLDAKAARSRGAAASTAARGAPWQAWREWICKDAEVSVPAKAHRNFKNSIVDVIRFRGGAGIPKPPRDSSVPKNLPVLRGRDQGPPSEDAIRRNLFGSRAK